MANLTFDYSIHINGFVILEVEQNSLPPLPSFGEVNDHIWFEPEEILEKGMLFKVKNSYEDEVVKYFKTNIFPYGWQIWGYPSFVDATVNLGVEQASFTAHTDYHEGDIDFFALMYPVPWDSQQYGGLLTISNELDPSFSLSLSPSNNRIIILNNMVPYVKHVVTPIAPAEKIQERALCTVSWKRGPFR